MTDDKKLTDEVSSTTDSKGAEQTKLDDKKVTEDKTIQVDVYGVSVDLPLSKAKELILKRDSKTKEYKDLQDKINAAESKSREATERVQLLELMKKSDVEAVEATVSQKYKDTISKFENKVYKGEVKSLLAASGILPEALQDAADLALKDAKMTLDGDNIKINDKDAKTYVEEWAKLHPHLLSVKQTNNGKTGTKPITPPKPQANIGDQMNKGLSEFFKKL